jgi:hypothetical protein
MLLDDRQRSIGEEADHELVDGGFSKLRLERELLARHPLARKMILNGRRDAFLAVVHFKSLLAPGLAPRPENTGKLRKEARKKEWRK